MPPVGACLDIRTLSIALESGIGNRGLPEIHA